LENEVNEIKDYVDARYLSAPEAVWHIFGFKFHHRSPAIQRLQIHLPNEQTVTFNDDTDIVTLLQNDRIRKTTLTEFFTANKVTNKRQKQQSMVSNWISIVVNYYIKNFQHTWSGNRGCVVGIDERMELAAQSDECISLIPVVGRDSICGCFLQL